MPSRNPTSGLGPHRSTLRRRRSTSRRAWHYLAALFCAGLMAATAQAQTKLLRFPDVHGDRVAFCYAGDIWTASAAGGDAVRLTAHPGLELFPKFSPDGRWIAFTGQYDGDEQVYVVPADGGVPRQLTFYPAVGPLPERWGYDNQVYDWSRDGKSVLFRSARYSYGLGDQKLFLAPVDGGLPEPLPMPEAGSGDLSPDGKRVVYSPLFRDFRSWKRYEGGWAQELWIFDVDGHDVTRVTEHPRSDRDAMWIGDAIVFNSDRSGTFNLYRYDVGSGNTTQLTQSQRWDVRWPSDDGSGRVIYELDGELQILDLAAGRSTGISIRVPDDGLQTRPQRVSAAGSVEGFDISPKGKRALFVARGDIFTAPIEHGPTRNLTRTPSIHEKGASWSPDGQHIVYLADTTGEEELWLIAQDGTGKPEQLTRGGSSFRYAPAWSPDGERLAFSDKDGRVFVLELEGRKLTEVADEARGQVFDYSWAPGGHHLAFSLSDPSTYRSIYVWSRDDGKTRRITGEMWNEYGPAWDPDGNFLYYLSDRMFQPQIGSLEWNYVVDRETGIYALALRSDVEHPFPPRSDEVELPADEEPGKGEGKKDEDGEDTQDEDDTLQIEWDGLEDRVVRVPVDPDNYAGLTAVKGHLIFIRGAPFYYGRGSDVRPAIQLFSIEDREVSTIVEGAGGYALSQDGKKLLISRRGSYQRVDVKKDGGKSAKSIATSGLQVDRVPAEEWPQIFDETWRRFRDFFYVENMHGYDWERLRDQYRPLLTHVAHRADLNYVISEMIAELNVGHAYIWGGEWTVPSRPTVALAGARFEADRRAGRYRIAEILPGQNEEPRYRSPLREVGVDAREGDFILAIDGQDLALDDNPYRLLRHAAGRPVTLTLNTRANADGAREVTFVPLSSESALRYLRMVETNRRKVSEMTGGRIGYLHIPDMGPNGIREFIKHFYGQIRKEGLVVDVRGNGGGNVSPMIIERLSRELLGTRFQRTSDSAGTYPRTVFHGHMACLLDEDSASDGDIFPHRFREAGLGPLIGKRSWGGVVGITSHGPLLDGGQVRVPQFGTNGLDGEYVIEGYGVAPDIEVENDPKSVIGGGDPQLERAIAEIEAAIRAEPRRLPSRPRDPVKTR